MSEFPLDVHYACLRLGLPDGCHEVAQALAVLQRAEAYRFVSKRGHHINGIENFWNQAKRVLRKYNGVPRKNFYLFLKECEFRFNYGTPKQQLALLRKWAKL